MRTVAEFDAFMSYSHVADGQFGPAFQRLLENFARRRRERAVRVFRDDANLSANAALWPSIEQALESSSWLLLLASPQSAQSIWSAREVGWWLEHRPADRILIGLTAGEIRWDSITNDIDWESTTALPRLLSGRLSNEPRWVDLRALRELPKLDDGDPAVHEALAEFSAPLREMAKDELIGAHVLRQRREARRIKIAAGVLAFLFLIASGAGVTAFVQGRRAADEARTATARLLAATAVKDLTTDSGRAQLLAVQGARLHRDPQTLAALFQAVSGNPFLVRQVQVGVGVTAMAGGADGHTLVVGTQDGRLMRWNAAGSGKDEASPSTISITDVAVSADGSAVAATDGRAVVVWRPGHTLVSVSMPGAGGVALSPSGRTLCVLVKDDGVLVIDAGSGRILRRASAHDQAWTWVAVPDEHTVVLTSAENSWERRSVRDLSIVSSSYEWQTPAGAFIPAASEGGAWVGYLKYGIYAVRTDGRAPKATSAPLPDALSNYTPGVFALSPNASLGFVGSGGHMWITEIGEPADGLSRRVWELTGSGGAEDAVFFGNSGRLATSEGAVVTIWSLKALSRLGSDVAIAVPEGPNASPPVLMSVSPDRRKVVVVGGFGQVLVGRLSDGSSRVLADEWSGAYTPVWRNDGSSLLIASDGAGYEISDGELHQVWAPSHEERDIMTARVTADERLIVVDDHGGIEVRDANTGAVQRNVAGRAQELRAGSGSGDVGVAAISLDGRSAILIEDRDEDRRGGPAFVVDIGTGSRRQLADNADQVFWSGDRIVVTTDRSVSIFDGSGAALRTIASDTDYAGPLAIMPGHVLVRLRNDGQADVVAMDSGSRLGTIQLPRGGGTSSSRWSATALVEAGGLLYTATPDGRLTRWELTEDAWVAVACATAGRELSSAEWRDLVGTEAPDDLRCRH